MQSRQRIRYLRTADDVQLAWAEVGTGPTLLKAANWLTHLEYDWDSPVWRHWIQFLSAHFRFVRYDERGCGMTDWEVGDLSFDRGLRTWRRSPMRPTRGSSYCSASRKEPQPVSRMR